MTARVLVVDDIPANVKLLEAKLSAEYFGVVTATNGRDAIALCERGEVDIVLLDVMMPGMNGFEVCRRLKGTPATAHIPVVIVTALDQPRDRLQGLDAGADDFLTKPLDDTALFARVRSLARLKAMTDELRSRAVASVRLGIADPLVTAAAETGLNGRILVIEDRPAAAERVQSALSAFHAVEIESDAQQAVMRAAEGDFDAVVISLGLQGQDGLRLCSQLRSLERTRNISVLLMGEAEDHQLTGLHNRRFMDNRLAVMFDESALRARSLSLLVLDIDHFKAVNDSWGHDAGDEVLREFADRVRACTRGIDLVARMGGEEIVVVLPDTGRDAASRVAERIRERVERSPFAIQNNTRDIKVTVSVGVANRRAGDTSSADMMKRADDALYRAKANGRNRVIVASAA